MGERDERGKFVERELGDGERLVAAEPAAFDEKSVFGGGEGHERAG